MQNDTICGIITALGASAINVIRISGDDSIKIANKIFKGKDLNKVKSHTVTYGYIKENDEIIDEVLVSVFLAPRTYTKENVVEISSHGGAFIVQKIINLLLAKGVRLADPGEFTKRAFLNGRIDLTKAEAVMDLINAKSNRALHLANQGLTGSTYSLISSYRQKILSLMGKIEVNIDYPEYDSEEEIENNSLKPNIISLIMELNKIIENANSMRVYREGITTAIVGKPNVGKSSLLNALINEDKAIVTDVSGTTRDIVEGSLNVNGITLNLIDTAGIRNTLDVVEKIGIEKTKKVIEKAELVLLVLDNSQKLDDIDLELLELTKDKKRLILANKSDLNNQINLENIINISTINKLGFDVLESQIKEMFIKKEIESNDEIFVSNTRHINLLSRAKGNLEDALKAIDNQMAIDFVEIDLTNAWKSLGEITGEVSNDLLLDELFSKFCLGK